jgi:trigger factor
LTPSRMSSTGAPWKNGISAPSALLPWSTWTTSGTITSASRSSTTSSLPSLTGYRGISVEKPVRKIDEKDVEHEIHHLRRINSTTSDTDEVADAEHVVIADVQEMDEGGVPLVGKKTPASRFYLADEVLAPEIKAALGAARVGNSYRATVETRHDDHAHKHHFEFTVTAIQKVVLPDLDEALVRKVTGDKVTSVDEFRTSIRKDLERYWEDQAMRSVNDSLANEIVRLHEFPVPDSLVDMFLDSFVDDVRGRSRDRQLPRGFDEAKFRAESRPQAVWQAKWLLLKERIAEEEKLAVTDEEIAALADREASRLNIDKERVLEYYRKSSSAAEGILSEKILDLLRKNAKIAEREIQETRE